MGAGVEESLVVWLVGAHTVCVADAFEISFGVNERFTDSLKTGPFVYAVFVMVWENGACRRRANLTGNDLSLTHSIGGGGS